MGNILIVLTWHLISGIQLYYYLSLKENNPYLHNLVAIRPIDYGNINKVIS